MAGRTKPLPGMEDEGIEEIRDAALTLFNIDGEISAAKKRKESAATKVSTLMAAHKLKKYRDPERELVVEITASKEKVRVLLGGKKKKKARRA